MSSITLVCLSILALAAVAQATQTCTISRETFVTPFGADPFQSYRLAMPCRYQLADFRVDVPGTGKGCRPRIFATGIRIGGLFYVNSFDVRLSLYSIEDPNNLEDYIAVKAFGNIKGGEFQTTLLVRNTVFDGGEKWNKTDDITGLEYFFPNSNYEFSETNGRVVFNVEACGLNIEFTHVKMDLSNLAEARLVVTIPDDDGGDITEYFDRENSACFESCLSAKDLARVMGANSPTDVMAYNVAGHWRLNPGHKYADIGLCRDMQSYVSTCPAENRAAALKGCMFMLTDRTYLGCASTDVKSADVITQFNNCIDAFCNGNGCASRTTAASCTIPSEATAC